MPFPIETHFDLILPFVAGPNFSPFQQMYLLSSRTPPPVRYPLRTYLTENVKRCSLQQPSLRQLELLQSLLLQHFRIVGGAAQVLVCSLFGGRGIVADSHGCAELPISAWKLVHI